MKARSEEDKVRDWVEEDTEMNEKKEKNTERGVGRDEKD